MDNRKRVSSTENPTAKIPRLPSLETIFNPALAENSLVTAAFIARGFFSRSIQHPVQPPSNLVFENFFPQAPTENLTDKEKIQKDLVVKPQNLFLNGFSLDQVTAIIKDTKILSCEDAAKNLGLEKTHTLVGFLRRHQTSYNKIKLEGITDAKILEAFAEDMHITSAALKLGVGVPALAELLANEKKHLEHQLFSRESPRP